MLTAIQEKLQRVGIQTHHGKTKLWNRSGVVPTGTEALTEAAKISDPDAIAWRGDVSLPPQERCVNALRTPKVREIHIGSSLGARPSDVTDSGNVRSPVRVDYVSLFSNNTAKLHVEGGASPL